VGWYYTHLASGIFLSAQDQELHRLMFSSWWMFALVIDAVQGSLGFFQWSNRQLVPSGFCLVS